MHTKYSKQAIGMQVTFILKNRLQKEYFLTNYDCFSGNFCVILNLSWDGNVHTYGTT